MPRHSAFSFLLAGCSAALCLRAPPQEPASRPAWRWGVTVDDVGALDATVDALRSLPQRPTTRIVFDVPAGPEDYRDAVRAIHRVSDVMGEIADSQAVARLSPAAYRARTEAYVAALGSDVDIWEIGNEVNGEWLGRTPDVVAKIEAAYDVVKDSGGRTALTLHYSAGCAPSPANEMFAWTEANVSAALREGLELVLVSYYEEDCHRLRPEWGPVFHRLAALFPRAALGIGECGATDPAAKEDVLRRTYRLRLAEPRFIGGFFWWYFRQDMVPSSKPLWTVLAGEMVNGDVTAESSAGHGARPAEHAR